MLYVETAILPDHVRAAIDLISGYPALMLSDNSIEGINVRHYSIGSRRGGFRWTRDQVNL